MAIVKNLKKKITNVDEDMEKLNWNPPVHCWWASKVVQTL